MAGQIAPFVGEVPQLNAALYRSEKEDITRWSRDEKYRLMATFTRHSWASSGSLAVTMWKGNDSVAGGTLTTTPSQPPWPVNGCMPLIQILQTLPPGSFNKRQFLVLRIGDNNKSYPTAVTRDTHYEIIYSDPKKESAKVRAFILNQFSGLSFLKQFDPSPESEESAIIRQVAEAVWHLLGSSH